MHLFAGTLVKCSNHFIVKVDGEAVTSKVTNIVFRIAVSPTFYKYSMRFVY